MNREDVRRGILNAIFPGNFVKLREICKLYLEPVNFETLTTSKGDFVAKVGKVEEGGDEYRLQIYRLINTYELRVVGGGDMLRGTYHYKREASDALFQVAALLRAGYKIPFIQTIMEELRKHNLTLTKLSRGETP